MNRKFSVPRRLQALSSSKVSLRGQVTRGQAPRGQAPRGRVLHGFLLGGALCALLMICAIGFWSLTDPAGLADDSLLAGYTQSARLFDRQGVLLRERVNGSGERANWVPLAEAGFVAQAVLAAEDARFFSHFGVDPLALLRAGIWYLQGAERPSGASTITMQLARILQSYPRTLDGKYLQIVHALKLERRFSKAQILEAYLNRAAFGPGLTGAGAAAAAYFDKTPAELSLGEAALLAGLLQGPVAYNPRLNSLAAEQRRQYVLQRMVANGMVEGAAAATAAGSQTQLSSLQPNATTIKAGHFGDYVLSLGVTGEVRTTLNYGLQAKVEALVAQHTDQFKLEGIGNAAVVVLDVASGDILSMVGSANWHDDTEGSVNGALAQRQPGSTLKPFAYELAFESGYSPATVLPDIETEYLGNDRTLYIPQNYSQSFRGPVLASTALAYSMNIPAIALVREVGLAPFLKRLQDLGFKSLSQNKDFYGLGLVLGNGEVSLLELATAYASLARGGWYAPPRALLDASPVTSQKIMDDHAVWQITAILSDEYTRTRAFGAANPLILGFPVAIKTGTSNNWRDTWVIGYTRDLVVAVWAGNFSAQPSNQMSGSSGAGPLFVKVMRLALAELGLEARLPDAVENMRRLAVCSESGQIPGPYCTTTSLVDLQLEHDVGTCTVHQRVVIDVRNGLIAAPGCPARFRQEKVVSMLPPEYDEWQESIGRVPPPREVSALAGAGSALALSIVRPRNNDVYVVEPGYERRTQTLEFKALSVSSIGRCTWIVDGKTVGSSPWPFTFSWPLDPGKHSLIVRQGTNESNAVTFEVR